MTHRTPQKGRGNRGPISANLVQMKSIADLITAEFKLQRPLNKNTPYVWWQRTREGRMDMPFPQPAIALDGTNYWNKQQIIEWYAKYLEGGI